MGDSGWELLDPKIGPHERQGRMRGATLYWPVGRTPHLGSPGQVCKPKIVTQCKLVLEPESSDDVTHCYPKAYPAFQGRIIMKSAVQIDRVHDRLHDHYHDHYQHHDHHRDHDHYQHHDHYRDHHHNHRHHDHHRDNRSSARSSS
jgi:hypothetical protein